MTIRRLVLLGGSGMVPGYLQGTYQEPDLAFDLRVIAARAGARFVQAAAERIDAGASTVEVAGERIGWDLLSVDVGSEPAGPGRRSAYVLLVAGVGGRMPGMRRPLFVVAILVLGTAFRASAVPVRIATARELTAAQLAAGRMPVVLDARSSRGFRAGHVPGSLRVDWRDFSESRPGVSSYLFGDPARWGLLAADRASLRDRLRALGLSASRPVVVVGDPSGWGEEGRVAWMLLYLGHPEVALLDGGFPAWKAENPEQIEKGAPRPPPPGDFEPVPQPARRIRFAALRSALAHAHSEVTLLDVRTAEEFAGKREQGQKRGGRIPGARLVPAAALRSADGRYVDGEALTELAGPLRRGAPVVTYCTGGVRSALLAVLLEARLGIVAANYDGSLWKWSSRDDLPLETGP